MDKLTDYLIREYGMDKSRAGKIANRVRIYDFCSPRIAQIDHIQLNEDGTAGVAEIDPSTGKISYHNCEL